jgi:hypothetical protein
VPPPALTAEIGAGTTRKELADSSPGCGCRVDRIMLGQPLLNFLFLGRQNHPLPAHLTRPFTIFRHDIGTFVEDLNQAVRLGPFEVIGGGSRVVFLHTLL